jgi:hypothetical protein
MVFLNFHPTSYCFMFLAQLIWLEGGDMPSLRGRQHAKHLQTVSVFTKSTDASYCIQRPGTGGMIPEIKKLISRFCSRSLPEFKQNFSGPHE